MPVCELIRGKKFPSFTEKSGFGYTLRLPVPPPASHINIKPPRSVVPEDTNIWPYRCFQLLLVASEYCAALLEFMAWAFPDGDGPPTGWGKLKAQVAGHARDFIRTSAAVPSPPAGEAAPPGSLESLQVRSAHSVWAAFTHCYFHGLAPAGNGDDGDDAPQEWRDATAWLYRLVGETGWQAKGSVYQAVQQWVDATRGRLRSAFPSDAPNWLGGMSGAAGEQHAGVVVAREVGARGRMDDTSIQGPYCPIYPLRVTSGTERNQMKWKLGGEECRARTVTGSCGVPAAYKQKDNCALGFLVLADSIQAFVEATKNKTGGPAELIGVRQEFLNTVVLSDTAALRVDHLQYGYPEYLASCALGWKLALEHLPRWLEAAADSVAAVGWRAEVQEGAALRIELLMPRSVLDPEALLSQAPQQGLQLGMNARDGPPPQQQEQRLALKIQELQLELQEQLQRLPPQQLSPWALQLVQALPNPQSLHPASHQQQQQQQQAQPSPAQPQAQLQPPPYPALPLQPQPLPPSHSEREVPATPRLTAPPQVQLAQPSPFAAGPAAADPWVATQQVPMSQLALAPHPATGAAVQQHPSQMRLSSTPAQTAFLGLTSGAGGTGVSAARADVTHGLGSVAPGGPGSAPLFGSGALQLMQGDGGMRAGASMPSAGGLGPGVGVSQGITGNSVGGCGGSGGDGGGVVLGLSAGSSADIEIHQMDPPPLPVGPMGRMSARTVTTEMRW